VTTSVSPDARRIWRVARVPVALLLVVFAVAVVTVLSRGDQGHGDLDPGSYDPGGSHAIDAVLTANGVDVQAVHTFDDAALAAPGATLLVVDPDLVPPDHLADLLGKAEDVVLVGPGQQALNAVSPALNVVGESEVSVRPPDCQVAAAVAAGSVLLGGIGYRTTNPAAQLCYRDGSAATLVDVEGPHGHTTVLGGGALLTNARVAENGNAELALRLLGTRSKLIWYVPSTADPALGSPQRSFGELIPRGWVYGAIQVFIAAALFALWRSRRLGPVVVEQLPVVVRAAETTEGRARLYRRSGASEHAAETLREAGRARLRVVLGLPVDAGPDAVAGTAAARVGRPVADVGGLLYGPPVGDDAGLVWLADALDELEQQVGRS
jgi:hypothetical protein